MINIVYSTFPFVRIASLGENYFTNSLTKVISDLADKGNIIILGRGSQIILKDHPNTFHIRFTADLDYRVEHLQKAHTMQNMPREEIIQTIRQEDKNRKEFIKYNFNQDIDNPLLYHLIIDCSKTSSAKIKQLIKNLID
jgi:cytidylate kinase